MPKTPKKKAVSTTKKRSKPEPSFEKNLEALEQIVEQLEEGGLSLDESLKKFEEGVGLAKQCEKTLSEAEKKIEILTKDAEGELSAETFGDEDDENESGKIDEEEDDEDADDGEMLF